MLERIAAWLVTFLLEYLSGKATAFIEEKAAVLRRDSERGEINEANHKAYNEALTRAERIRDAENLLNRIRA